MGSVMHRQRKVRLPDFTGQGDHFTRLPCRLTGKATLMRNTIGFGLLLLGSIHVVAQPGDLPQNTIDCAAFIKRANGSWYVGGTTTFDFGSHKNNILARTEIHRRYMTFDGVDLFDILERKCGPRA
jgi:hypothetical protein